MDESFDYNPSQDYPYTGQAQDYNQANQAYQNPEQYAQPVQQVSAQPSDIKERISEIAEVIIDEKWNELLNTVQKIVEWKDRVDQRITTIEQQIKNISENSDRVQKAVLEKVNEYNATITDVNTELKALEKVFQKILPGFVENVNELSRITKTLKEVKKP